MSTSSSLLDYLMQFQKLYAQLRKFNQPQNCFRIIDIKHNQQNECLLIIQVIGKATVFESTPQEIVMNDKLLEGFSKQDVRTITYFAAQEIKKPDYQILVQEFNNDLNKMTFKIGKRGSSQYITRSADQISLDKELLNQLTQEDAHKVGYATGMEQNLKEKEYLNQKRP